MGLISGHLADKIMILAECPRPESREMDKKSNRKLHKLDFSSREREKSTNKFSSHVVVADVSHYEITCEGGSK